MLMMTICGKTFNPTNKMIDRSIEVKKQINGANVKVTINEACVQQPHYPFGVVAKMEGTEDEVHLYEKGVQFKDASQEDLDKLVFNIKVGKCVNAWCGNHTFNHEFIMLPDVKRDGQCFECLRQKVHSETDLRVKQSEEVDAKKNIEMLEKGFTYRYDISGIDKSGKLIPARIFTKEKTSKDTLLKTLKKGKGIVQLKSVKATEM